MDKRASGGHLVNIDELLPLRWTDECGNRAFRFDAFISHNWRDSASDLLFDRLSDRGLRAWHDRHEDVRDRRVTQRIARALQESRTIVVCVGPDYHPTPWCRAEYLNGLRSENDAAISRVVVATTGSDARVPNELIKAPRFIFTEDASCDHLATYVQSQNQLPFELPSATGNGALLDSDELDWLRHAARSVLATTSEEEADEPFDWNVWAVRYFAAANGDRFRAFNDSLYKARSILQRLRKETWSFTAEETRLIALTALYFASSPDVDNRANALMTLIFIHDNTPCEIFKANVLNVLSLERSENVLTLAHQWIRDNIELFTEKDWPSIGSAILRTASMFRWYTPKPILLTLPAVIRARVLSGSCLDLDCLPVKERAHLLSERIRYLCDRHPPSGEPLLGDNMARIVGVPEVEPVLREFHAIMFNDELPNPLGVDTEDIYKHFVASCELIADQVKSRRPEFALDQMDDFVVSLTLVPLLLCTTEKTVAEQAAIAFLKVCDAMEQQEVHRERISRFRDVVREFRVFTNRTTVENDLWGK